MSNTCVFIVNMMHLSSFVPNAVFFVAPFLCLLSPKALVPAAVLLCVAIIYAAQKTNEGQFLPCIKGNCASWKLSFSKSVLAFFFWCALSLFYASSPVESAKMLIQIASLCLLAYVAFGSTNNTEASKINFKWLPALFVLCVIIGYFDIRKFAAITGFFKQTFLSFGHHNYAFTTLNRPMCCLAILFWAVAARLIMQKKSFVALLINVSLVILFILQDSQNDGSQTALLAIICSSIAFTIVLVLKGAGVRLVQVGLIFVSCAFILAVMLTSPDQLADWFPQLPDSVKHRFCIWRHVANISLDNWMFGIGFDSARHVGNSGHFCLQLSQIAVNYEIPLHAHNVALQLLLETGIVGLILAFALLYCGISSSVNTLSSSSWSIVACSVACIVGSVVLAFTAFGIWQLWQLALFFITQLCIKLIALSAQPKALPQIKVA